VADLAKFEMTEGFTSGAFAAWNALDSATQELIRRNAWCSQCREMVEMTVLSGHLKGGHLVLEGKCARCDAGVSRLVERSE
jgi:hypothetical protein